MMLVNGQDTKKRYPVSIEEMACMLAVMEYREGIEPVYSHSILTDGVDDSPEDIQKVYDILDRMGLPTNIHEFDEEGEGYIICSSQRDTQDKLNIIKVMAEMNIPDDRYYRYCSELRRGFHLPNRI